MMKITIETFEKAIIFAVNAHSGQLRKGVDSTGFSLPYIMHPFSVMKRIFDNKESKNMYMLACAAILHDTVEDVEWVTLDLIYKEFGPHIAALVSELTLDKSQYELIGKKEYLAHELNIMSPYALAIKLCDRLENVCDMETVDQAFRDKYIPETWYILPKLNRVLSSSHKKLIQQIKGKLQSYNTDGAYDEYVIVEETVVKNAINSNNGTVYGIDERRWTDKDLLQFVKECMKGGYPESLLMVWNHEI